MEPNTFDAFMEQRRRVAAAYANGDPAPLREISASSDPVTFFGPGGGVEQGAAHVLAVNEAGSRRFQPGGTTELEVLQQGAAGDLAYWTGLQRATVRTGDAPKPVAMMLRVTEVFRREGDAWKLVHRHADPLHEAGSKR